jgi:hypothetical protein
VWVEVRRRVRGSRIRGNRRARRGGGRSERRPKAWQRRVKNERRASVESIPCGEKKNEEKNESGKEEENVTFSPQNSQ